MFTMCWNVNLQYNMQFLVFLSSEETGVGVWWWWHFFKSNNGKVEGIQITYLETFWEEVETRIFLKKNVCFSQFLLSFKLNCFSFVLLKKYRLLLTKLSVICILSKRTVSYLVTTSYSIVFNIITYCFLLFNHNPKSGLSRTNRDTWLVWGRYVSVFVLVCICVY